MAIILNTCDLPSSETSRQYEGYLNGDTNISFFVNSTPSGKGPSLHLHPYAEVFIVLEGQLSFTAGEETFEADGGQIVVVPAETLHKFLNSGSTVARSINIHTSRQMITTWVEE